MFTLDIKTLTTISTEKNEDQMRNSIEGWGPQTLTLYLYTSVDILNIRLATQTRIATSTKRKQRNKIHLSHFVIQHVFLIIIAFL